MVRDFRMPLFRLCLRVRVEGASAGKTGREEDWMMELRKGKMVRGSVGYMGCAWETWREEIESVERARRVDGGRGKLGREV